MSTNYQERSDEFEQKAAKEERFLRILGLFRAIAFIGGVISAITYANQGGIWYLPLALLMLGVFVILVIRYQEHQSRNALYSELKTINKEENQRVNFDLKELEQGKHFEIVNHSYHEDLDIFGEHSLFQLVSRCALPSSQSLLSKWLSGPATKETILSRQQAIKELSGQLDWCQHFEAKIRLSLKKKKKEAPSLTGQEIIDWVKTHKTLKINSLIPWLLNAVTLMSLGLIFFTDLPYQIIYISLVANGIHLGFILRKLPYLTKGIHQAHYLIRSYSEAIKPIEKAHFKANRLVELQAELHKPTSASKAIGVLSDLTQKLDSRANMLYVALNFLLVLDSHLLIRLISWRNKYCDSIESWLNAVHEVECLMSIGGLTHANPTFCFPEITSDYSISGVNIGHPLISAKARVNNDYLIDGLGAIHIITGSNMSGKSTFERTLDVNLVLAFAGAPVCADRFETGIFNVFTSMRTRDNLEDNTSSFYAELKRLKLLLQHLDKGEPVFFLLDEILKGTNSEDRHKGAVALVHQLVKSSGLGMISTHDVDLGHLSDQLNKVSNYSFNSTIENDEIRFDYKLTEGICNSFNASQLMKNMGIID